MKNFITLLSLQPKGDLKKPIYKNASDNPKLTYGEPTSFPIIQLIHGYAEKGEKIKITVLLTDNKDVTANYENYFIPELEALSIKMEFEYIIDKLTKPQDESIEVNLKFFTEVIEKINDEEQLFICRTFGQKPTTEVMSMALNYAYQIKKNTTIECIVYGEVKHPEPEDSKIYDHTALFYMNSIVNKLAKMKAPDPLGAIKLMLGIDGGD